MKFNVQNFATLRLSVADVAKSRDWYEKFFAVAPVESFTNFVSFHIVGLAFDIVLADDKSPVSTGGSVGYFKVDDLDSVIFRALELGGRIYRGPLVVPEIGRTILQIQDPYGNVVGFEY